MKNILKLTFLIPLILFGCKKEEVNPQDYRILQFKFSGNNYDTQAILFINGEQKHLDGPSYGSTNNFDAKTGDVVTLNVNCPNSNQMDYIQYWILMQDTTTRYEKYIFDECSECGNLDTTFTIN